MCCWREKGIFRCSTWEARTSKIWNGCYHSVHIFETSSVLLQLNVFLFFFCWSATWRCPYRGTPWVTWPFCCHNTLPAKAYQLIYRTLYQFTSLQKVTSSLGIYFLILIASSVLTKDLVYMIEVDASSIELLEYWARCDYYNRH